MAGKLGVVEVFTADAATVGDVVFHQAQPVHLLWRKDSAALGVVAEDPGLEAFIHLVGKGFEFGIQPQGEAQQRDQVSELALAADAFDLMALDTGVGAPEFFGGEQERRLAQAFVQFFDHVEGECTALVGLLVEKGERGNVIFVLLEVVGKALDGGSGLRFGLLAEA